MAIPHRLLAISSSKEGMPKYSICVAGMKGMKMIPMVLLPNGTVLDGEILASLGGKRGTGQSTGGFWRIDVAQIG